MLGQPDHGTFTIVNLPLRYLWPDHTIPAEFAGMFSVDTRCKLKLYLTVYHVLKSCYSFKYLRDEMVCDYLSCSHLVLF